MKKIILLSLLLPVLLVALMVRAELTATVSPGYTFSATERADTSKLNRLGMPTITITGTLDGTNAGIGAGSINGNMLSPSAVDGVTISFTNSSPQALRIAGGGVNVREISTNIAGLGLGGGDGYALSNKVDGVGLVITNDVLALNTNLSPSYLNVNSNYVVIGSSTNTGMAVPINSFLLTLSTNQFESAEMAATGSAIDIPHGLGVKPTWVRWVMRCVDPGGEAGYSAGDEVPIDEVVDVAVGGVVWGSGANSTNVFCSAGWTYGLAIRNKNNSAGTPFTPSKWRIVCYARP